MYYHWAHIFHWNESWEKAIELYQACIETYNSCPGEKLSAYYGLRASYLQGQCLFRLDSNGFEDVLKLHQSALEIATKESVRDVQYAKYYLGLVYLNQGNKAKDPQDYLIALEHFKEVLAEKDVHPVYKVRTYLMMADIFSKLGRTTDAKRMLNSALVSVEEVPAEQRCFLAEISKPVNKILPKTESDDDVFGDSSMADDVCDICFEPRAICNGSFRETRLACGHVMGTRCIINWLIMGSPTCPICRDPISEADLALTWQVPSDDSRILRIREMLSSRSS